MSNSKPTLYSLHVGINKYPSKSNVSTLDGCVNDALKWSAFIDKQFKKSYDVQPETLLDNKATYKNIISHFGKKHLLKAGKGDLVFFTFSGHGSREKSATEFKDPQGKGETLVCYDSRPSGLDLADKELAVLIKRIEEKGAYIVTLLDCCHSGSGFRGDEIALGKPRQSSDRTEKRPLKDYLKGYYSKMKKETGKITVPLSNQLNIAACDRTEKAYEHANSGLFSYCMLNILNDTPKISYATLFQRCRHMMAKIADKQHPKFEPTGMFSSHELFLQPGKTGEVIRHQLKSHLNKWEVNMGAVHGVPAASDNKVLFAIYEKNGEQPIGTATASNVHFQKTKVELDFDGNNDTLYEAELISMPEPGIEMNIDSAFKKRLKEIQKKHDDVKPIFTSFNAKDKSLKYSLKYTKKQIELHNNLTGELVKGFKTTKRITKEQFLFKEAFTDINHVGQWERMLSLQKNSRALASDKFKFEMFVGDGKKGQIDNLTVQLFGQDGKFEEVDVDLQISNPHNKDLFFSLLYLRKDYSIMSLTSDIISAKEKGKSIFQNNVFLSEGDKELTFYLKLIVSTEEIESQLLELESIKDLGEIVDVDHKSGFGGINGPKAKVEDWFVKTMEVRLLGIDKAVNDSQAISLEEGKIKILPNAKISASVNTAVADSGNHRSTSPLNILPRLFDEDEATFLQPSGGTRSTSSNGPIVLNLENLKGTANIKKHPLEIEVAEKLKKNETLVPVTFDGEKIVILGKSEKQRGGKVKVTVDKMPKKQPSAGTRSPGKALWLYFLKVVKIETAFLKWAEMSGGKVKRRTRGLPTKVKNADRILLVVHGIIGDTKGMAQLALEVAEATNRYDLVLTFDYENLNTPINETSAILKKQLEEVAGITKDKEFTIMAHSMGGLVSRYYIENLKGNKIVNHLIMAGTPNLGSNFGKVPQYMSWANKILGFVGTVGLAIPYAASLIGFLSSAEKVLVTLAMMNYDDESKFLKNLEKNSDPGIPYTIVSGALKDYIKEVKKSGDAGTMDKILNIVADVFNGKTDNDIAVEVDSIKGVPAKGRKHPLVIHDVACHHLNYFAHPAGSDVVREVLKK